MRLCLASLHPRVLSGQIDSLAGLARALEGRGHQVQLVAPFDTAGLLDGSLIELDGGPRGLAQAAKAMLATVPRVAREGAGADLLHLALPTPAFSWLGDLVQRASGIPVVVGFEGHLAGALDVLGCLRRPRGLRGTFPLWAINNGLFGRLNLRSAKRYVVSSEYQRAELLALGHRDEHISVLPNILDATKLASCEPRWARRRLGLPEGLPVVGYIGHFNDVKGVDVLASAFAALVQAGHQAHLALAWSGQGDPAPIRRGLAGIESSVTWLGKVHVGTFLSAIDVLALPYRSTAGQAAYPSLLLEAMHAGRPLVTTDLPLLKEVAAGGRVALLCPPNRPQDLARQLELLLSCQPLRRGMARAQQRLAREFLAPDVLAERYEALYRSTLAVPSRSERWAAA